MGRPENGTAAALRPGLLWDVGGDAVDRERHRDFLVGRVLGHGRIEEIRALRRDIGDDGIREYLARTRGRRVDRRRLRYLEAILDLGRTEVDAWLEDAARRVWDER